MGSIDNAIPASKAELEIKCMRDDLRLAGNYFATVDSKTQSGPHKGQQCMSLSMCVYGGGGLWSSFLEWFWDYQGRAAQWQKQLWSAIRGAWH